MPTTPDAALTPAMSLSLINAARRADGGILVYESETHAALRAAGLVMRKDGNPFGPWVINAAGRAAVAGRDGEVCDHQMWSKDCHGVAHYPLADPAFPLGTRVLVRLADDRGVPTPATVVDVPRYEESGRLRDPRFDPETHVYVRTSSGSVFCPRLGDVVTA